ncbi:MAG: acyl carrier protein [Candidatus Sulfotelmatobacter sp.]
MDSVLQIIRAEVGDVQESTTLDELNIDSLELLDLLQKVEGACGVRIPDARIVNINSIGDIVATVDGLRN